MEMSYLLFGSRRSALHQRGQRVYVLVRTKFCKKRVKVLQKHRLREDEAMCMADKPVSMLQRSRFFRRIL